MYIWLMAAQTTESASSQSECTGTSLWVKVSKRGAGAGHRPAGPLRDDHREIVKIKLSDRKVIAERINRKVTP
jgi:hypothetical protein